MKVTAYSYTVCCPNCQTVNDDDDDEDYHRSTRRRCDPTMDRCQQVCPIRPSSPTVAAVQDLRLVRFCCVHHDDSRPTSWICLLIRDHPAKKSILDPCSHLSSLSPLLILHRQQYPSITATTTTTPSLVSPKKTKNRICHPSFLHPDPSGVDGCERRRVPFCAGRALRSDRRWCRAGWRFKSKPRRIGACIIVNPTGTDTWIRPTD